MSGPTVVVVVLSHRCPAQVQRLADRLVGDGDTFVAVHHDPAGEPLDLRPSSAVAAVPDPIEVRWGRLSVVHAVRHALAFARREVPELGWVLVVSGQDYPIRTMPDIAAELSMSPYDAYVRHVPLEIPRGELSGPGWQRRAHRRYLYRRRLPGSPRAVTMPWPRPNPFGPSGRRFAGDMWVNLSARAVDKVLDGPHNVALLSYLRRAPIPDEMYAATAVLTGAPELRVANTHRRLILWPGGGSRHPLTLTPEDMPIVLASDAFFARKIDSVAHPEMCDLLDEVPGRRRAPDPPPTAPARTGPPVCG